MIRIPLPPLLLVAFVLIPSLSIAADEISFTRDIAPLLNARCASCHLTGQEEGNMALHAGGAYTSLVNVPSVESKLLRVKPGAPQESYLLLKLEGTHLDAGGSGARMPFGAPPLSDETLQRIRSWIEQGAPQ